MYITFLILIYKIPPELIFTVLLSLTWEEKSESNSISYISSVCVCSVTQSCPTLCDPMDCGPPDSSVHGILQTRIQEQVAISSSRGSSRPRDQTHVSYVSCIGRWVLYQLYHLAQFLSVLANVKHLHTHTHTHTHQIIISVASVDR